jgi:hypothetical protein
LIEKSITWKKIAYVKKKGSNLNIIIILLKTIVNCNF